MENTQLTRRNFLLKLGSTAGLFSTPFISTNLFAATSGKLTAAKLSGNNGSVNVSFILNSAVKYKVFTLKNPNRVVIDLQKTKMQGNLQQGKQQRHPLTGIRYATHSGGKLRVVLDLNSPVKISSNMKAQGGSQVLTVSLRTGAAVKAAQKQAPAQRRAPTPARSTTPAPSRQDNFVVVIDPGHGGHDPGAIGRKGTREKDVVLAVSRRLKARIDAAPGMRAIMTRSNDTFVPLRKRIDIARNNNADLFVSVHADASHSSRIRGSSVYILSDKGASSEAAKLLAKSENSAYEVKIGDVRLAGNSAKVASILLDLSQNETMDRSLELAKSTLSELARVSNPLRSKVESAGFVVLKAPDIPSVLVETAFISNPQEEKRLRTASYQQKLADAMFKGVRKFQIAHAPNTVRGGSRTPRVQRASARTNNYVVRSGDSLSKIADRHGVSVSAIKSANRLRSSTIRVGQKLKIPT
ncbi:MAG: N-acetylmuramoyl-L-alanine amidase (EC [uncultured Thiotrichaceae bacterium]|uniref:N-acetylmuramoyl-L-alanine amidase AmiC n=1 Tax=uncultured Thiotrichaceae bacterium TaxID=298394 RepID=A0A6S6SPY0_9GAMM|nr:MAG: N-acetylmuramoyl-L-alanine amidase (EC [uncultured Thiotrichaceae bacterium]